MITDTGDMFCDARGCNEFTDFWDGYEGWTETYRPHRHWCPEHNPEGRENQPSEIPSM